MSLRVEFVRLAEAGGVCFAELCRRVFGNANKHAWPDVVTIVEREHKIRPTFSG